MRLLLRATHQLSFRLQRAEHEALSQCSRRCAANREHLVPAAPLCCGMLWLGPLRGRPGPRCTGQASQCGPGPVAIYCALG